MSGSGERAAIGRRLVAWYREHRRDLPWRGGADAYGTWISEIMLQQTTVAAVSPRFVRFLELFPDVASLARATEEEVLAEVQGLGYYRRFRAMKRAAERILEHHGGEIPRERRALEALPGIGEYTAGAILSIAHGLREPAVDGNVVRVLSRLFSLAGHFETPARKRALGALVLELMPEGAASDFNQALFDLGARICLPRAPLCADCPIACDCRALAEGRTTSLPELAPRPETVERVVAVALIEEEGGYLFERRGDDERRMPGFFQLPEVWCEGLNGAAAALVHGVAERHGVELEVGEELARCRHGITVHRLDCRLYRARLASRGRASLRRIAPDALAERPVSTISRKLLRAVARRRPGRAGRGRGAPRDDPGPPR